MAVPANKAAICLANRASGNLPFVHLNFTGRLPIAVNPTQDKATLATDVSSMAEAGHMFLPKGIPWLDTYTTKMTAFPQGRFDDHVDASTQSLGWARSRLFVPKTELAGRIGVFESRYGSRAWSGDLDGILDTSRITGWGP